MKNYIYLTLSCFALLLTHCTSSTEESATVEEEKALTLTKVWETDTTLMTPESVLFDTQNDVFYVSCIGNVPPTAKDGDGYIAVLDTDGNITNPKWVTGLDAPKGMAVANGILFVADVTDIVMINTKSGEIMGRKSVEGAIMLNDVDVNADGTIFFTDSGTNKAYSLKDDALTEMFTDSVTLKKPNGVFVDGSKLMVVGMESGKLVSYGPSDKSFSTVADSLFGGDGVEKYKNGYFVSNWNGEIFHLNSTWKRNKVLDTKEAKLNAADIEVVESKNLILVPTFFGNTVAAYRID